MIIFNLDGTLADHSHRQHFIDPFLNPDYEEQITNHNGYRYKEWIHKRDVLLSDPPKRKKFISDEKAYYEACDKDMPITQTIEILKQFMMNDGLDKSFDIEIWTDRPESVRQKTIEWLVKNIEIYPYNLGYFDSILKMRPVRNYMPEDQLKKFWLDEAIAAGKTIEFVFDSDQESTQMWKRRGIFVFDCNQQRD